MSNKKSYVHVPSNVVRNENLYLNNDEFLLYARICYLYYRNFQESAIEIDHRKLMSSCLIRDTRTFRKRLKVLFENKLILNKIEKLPTKGSLVIKFNNEVFGKGKHFTQMNAGIFTYILNEKINTYAFRQLFYYKSHINVSDRKRDRSFCFVGYETLVERLKIGRTKIKETNDLLEKLKLIKIEKHTLGSNNEYDENDELIVNRYNNHYILHHELF